MCSDSSSTAGKSRVTSTSSSSASSAAPMHLCVGPSERRSVSVAEASSSPQERKLKRQRLSMTGNHQLGFRRLQSKNTRREIAAIVMLCVAGSVFVGTQIHNYAVLDLHEGRSYDATAGIRRFNDKALKGAAFNVFSGGSHALDDDDTEGVGWPHAFIHVVNTRFMQHQAHLHDLAAARLLLFKAFCLPTMIRQTAMDHTLRRTPFGHAQNQRKTATSTPLPFASSGDGIFDHPSFVWIVKVDPEMPIEIRTEMIQLLEPYPNFFLVASNKNFGVGVVKGGWRGGEAGREILRHLVDANPGTSRGWNNSDIILTGDIDLLRRAHRFRAERIILETRLDADDGLNIQYLEKVQEEALIRLSDKPLTSFSEELNRGGDDGAQLDHSEAGETPKSSKGPDSQVSLDPAQKAKWTYWCSMNHIEWDPSPPLEDSTFELPKNASSAEKFSAGAYGSFVPWRSPQDCITPGLTIGLSVGIGEHDYPRFTHINIGREIVLGNGGTCGVHPKRTCLRMVDDPKIGAFRSRTPTSAGMRGVVTDGDKIPEVAKQIEEKAKDPKVFAAMWSVLRVHFSVTEEAIVYVSAYIRDNLVAIVADNLRGQCTHGHSCKITSREELQRLMEVAGGGAIDTQLKNAGANRVAHRQELRQLYKER